jgi:hypothetical protein
MVYELRRRSMANRRRVASPSSGAGETSELERQRRNFEQRRLEHRRELLRRLG